MGGPPSMGSAFPQDNEESCVHEWMVLTADGDKPVVKEGLEDEVEAWALIEEDKETRYAECNVCGRTLNA